MRVGDFDKHSWSWGRGEIQIRQGTGETGRAQVEAAICRDSLSRSLLQRGAEKWGWGAPEGLDRVAVRTLLMDDGAGREREPSHHVGPGRAGFR